ncbi:hypothetical protein [Clostridium oryzae]|uniref:hypothetical protein n=1 Tax=Clostridium oryzae TaxID=1450648 RepID=UPI001473C6D1|nr:hypothetical protein [Clostridium oryzae]
MDDDKKLTGDGHLHLYPVEKIQVFFKELADNQILLLLHTAMEKLFVFLKIFTAVEA